MKQALNSGWAALVITLAVAGCKTGPDCGCDGACPADAGRWQTIFDGKSTDALRGYKMQTFPGDVWKVEAGTLHALPGKGTDLVTKEKFQDFELELEWKVSPGGNSGVIYRVAETEGPPWWTGPEMQILDDEKHHDGKNPLTSAGALYALIAPNEKKHLKAVGEWNRAKIVMRSNHVEHWLNGEKIVEYTWDSAEVKSLIAKSKFKDKPRFMQEEEGHLDFQHHGQEVWLRNIRVRKL